MDKVAYKELMENITCYTDKHGVDNTIDMLSKMLLIVAGNDSQYSSSKEFEEGRVFIITNKTKE